MTARWLASAGCLSPFGLRDIADKLLLGGEHTTNRSKARADELSNLERYERIARFYDLLDLPFEYGRYQKIRPLLFEGLSGRLLDAGVGTGRNFPFYPLEHLPKRLNRGIPLRERIGFKVCAGVEASMDGETVFGGSACARCWDGTGWRYHPGNCGATWSEYQLCRALP